MVTERDEPSWQEGSVSTGRHMHPRAGLCFRKEEGFLGDFPTLSCLQMPQSRGGGGGGKFARR